MPAILAGGEQRATGAGVAPATHLEAMALEAWSDALGAFPLTRDADFFEEGGDSIAAVVFVDLLEMALGKDCIDIESLVEGPSFDEIVKTLARPTRDLSVGASAVVRFRRFESTARPIILVHVITGEVLFLRHIDPELIGRPVVGLRSRGLDGQEPPLRTVATMASRYISDLRRDGIVPPYFVGGYSAGGLVAYEIAHQLEAQGETCHLMLIDTKFPSAQERAYVDGVPEADVVIAQLKYLYLLQLQNGLKSPGTRDPLDQLFREATSRVPTVHETAALAESLARRGAIPIHWGVDDMEAQAAVFASNVAATYAYEPPSLHTPAALLTAVPDSAAAADNRLTPNEIAWSIRVPHVELHRAVGEHEALFWEGQALAFLDRVARSAERPSAS